MHGTLGTGPSRRAALAATLLAGAVVLTGVLAYQAYDAARSQRRTAETVLNEYAAFAGWEFSRAVSKELESTLQSSLSNIERAITRDGTLPTPQRNASASSSDCECRALVARTVFRMALDGSELVTTGADLSETLAGRIRASLRDRAAKPHSPSFAIVTDAGQARLVGTMIGHSADRSGHMLLGFVADSETMTPAFQRILTQHPLLPPALAGQRTAALLSARVADPTGTTLFESGPADPGRYRASGTLSATLGNLSYEIALQPKAAEALLIGGLPRSRLPLLAGLVALTTGLVLMALWQLRREYELTRLREDFVSAVSHELRTPLAQIRLFSETMLLGRVRSEGEARRSLEIINQEAQRLGHLVENVLSFARGGRGIARATLEQRSLPQLVHDIAESFAPLARTRQARIVVSAPDEAIVQIDAAAFRQVLLNLLDNAAKYGPVGQTITVSLADHDTHARMTVDDQGPGVAAADRLRIWQPFARARDASQAAVAGTGIGLAVVKDVARVHGWHVDVDTAPSGGARFIVDVPRMRDAAADRVAAASRSQAQA
jgi:signal transduction histidine kinase